MIERLVALSISRRAIVVALAGLLGVLGWLSWRELSVEAYPDIADTSAQVITMWSGHAAEEIEQQVTVPLERALNGTPGLEMMRSRSTFGLSIITLVFQDGVADYFARQRVNERIGQVALPPGTEIGLDPLTSPTGEVFRYTLRSPARSQRELRELQRWIVVPALQSVPGVADVANFGGETLQFELELQPDRLFQYGLTLDDVISAIQHNNANAGGSMMIRGDQAFVVRGLGLVQSLEDLGNIVVSTHGGAPVFVRSLGEVRFGALPRNGVLGRDDDADGVSGIVLLLRGENPSRVLDAIHATVASLEAHSLPDDVEIDAYMDRTTLVETTLHTVSHTMLEGIALVCVVLILFLGSPRAALIVALTIPLSLLIAFTLMRLTNIPANLLSLGAIDFGIIVDGAIVIMEALLRWREEHPDDAMGESDATRAAVSVARPVFFAKVIVITAYLPLFAFQRVEGKLFSPMAWTVGFALFGALVLGLTLVPGLSLAALRRPRKPWHNPILTRLEHGYASLLERVLARPMLALAPGIAAAIGAVVLAITVGKGFLPELDEGSLWLQVQLPPGLSLQRASEFADEIRQVVREEPQVRTVVTQLGRNDDGTDPWTPSHIESSIQIYPYETWPEGMTKHDLIDRLAARLERIPGIVFGFSQPIIDGVNDKIAGAHSDLVVKVFGPDLAVARSLAEQVIHELSGVQGAVDLAIDQDPPLPQLQVVIDRSAAARYGINVQDVAQLIEVAIGGSSISDVFIEERRYEVAVRFPADLRGSPDAIGNLTIAAPDGARIPISQIARIDLRSGESMITRERSRRHVTVRLNLRDRDLSSFLDQAQSVLRERVPMPNGFELTWGGQFENQQRAARRLGLILPLVLALIFVLLYGAFGRARHAAMILGNVPLAMLGGMVALHLRGMTLNVSSAVGLITLFGVAVQNGVILVSGLEERRRTGEGLIDAVRHGAVERFRAVLLTATVAALGMLPAALAHGIGSDVQRPLATVVVGGLVSATLLTLFVLPALYLVIESRGAGPSAPSRGSMRPAVVRPTEPPPLAGDVARVVGVAVLLLAVWLPSSAWAQETVTFGTYLSRVIEHNERLRAEEDEIRASEAEVQIGARLPDPRLWGGISQLDVSGVGYPTTSILQLDVPIELGDRQGRRMDVARAHVAVARAGREVVARDLRSSLAHAWVDVLFAMRRREALTETERRLDRWVETNEARVRAGAIGEIELVQSRVEARLAETQRIAGEAAVTVAELGLLAPLPREDARPVRAEGTIELGARTFDLDALRAGARDRRPEAQAARAVVVEAEAGVEVAEADRWADITFSVNWMYSADARMSVFQQPAFHTIGALVGIPLPLRLAWRGEIDASEARVSAAEHREAAVLRTIDVEIEQALVRYRAATTELEVYEGAVLADAARVVEAKQYEYARGGASLVEVLVAQRTAIAVRLAYDEALAEHAHALVDLEAAAGLWDLDFRASQPESSPSAP